ncbi:glutamate decarboxylase [Eubacteriaceae bacterium ES3]|nr:glutamate decarboxylase [Eubacteriaceae bacterium ES3]
MLHSRPDEKEFDKDCYHASVFSEEVLSFPKYHLNDESVDPELAYRIIKNDLMDEGNARQNLATFCQTDMEPWATRLMSETLEKNAIDKSEYPQTADLEKRCVNILADLWNAPKKSSFIGTSTVGSSEACMLGGMAMKFRWRKEAEKNGLDIYRKKPNLIISSGFQVCWEKFCVYWDIELRTVPVEEKHLSLNLDTVMDYVDDYTIGIVAIMGITYTGKYDDVKRLNELVEEYNQTASYKVPIHVDGASGGMFTPFAFPDLEWDFRLSNVISINTSGHKYGLVYPGIGWIIWKDREYVPEELIFDVSYLGGDIPTMAINFSRSASQIIGQYFNFLSLGFSGYQHIQMRTRNVAMYIASEIEKTGLFEIINDGDNIPIVCWKMKVEKQWNLYDLADRLRMNGWQVPAYPLPENMEETLIQRVVVRQDLNRQLASLFIEDFNRAIDDLNHARILFSSPEDDGKTYGFTH